MTSDEHWSEIWAAFEKSEWARLLELCTRFEIELPDFPYARLLHASALTGLKRFAEAQTILDELQNDRSASATLKYHCFVRKGEISEELGRFDDARKAYEAAHELCPNKMQPLIYRGVVDLRTGNLEAAREWLNRALNCPTGAREEAHLNIGNTYLAQQDYDKAIEHYQKAITLDPDYDIAWKQRADAKSALEIREQSK
jgi:tetratricopeptide (TPR) repeat protein